MQRTAILNLVGLSPRLLGKNSPHLCQFIDSRASAVIEPVFPALTCSAQATYLTGLTPAQHGIVANGWYDRSYAEHRFWKQSNHLVTGKKLWESLREDDPDFTCAKLFWWFNMYSSADFSITPRPMYPADGRKVFDIHTHPMDMREKVKESLGPFPFRNFWGPNSGIASSQWIADAAQWIEKEASPNLNLVYLPHLDYSLQKFGPAAPEIADEIRSIDQIFGQLLSFFQGRGVEVIVLSEYGITPVDHPIHLNRLFRKNGWLSLKNELGRETLDLGSSRAFAVADHQIAHVYVQNSTDLPLVRSLLENTKGVGRVLDGQSLQLAGLNHERSGDLVVEADARSWFTYYFWEDDKKAPDYARCVDIHRKPGYDPVELFFDPKIFLPKWKAAWKLGKKSLGFRTLMDLIPLDANLVRGSHGRLPEDQLDWPIMIGSFRDLPKDGVIKATEVHEYLKAVCSR